MEGSWSRTVRTESDIARKQPPQRSTGTVRSRGLTVLTPVFRNSLSFRVTTASPRLAAVPASMASGRWLSSDSPRRRSSSRMRAHSCASDAVQSSPRSSKKSSRRSWTCRARFARRDPGSSRSMPLSTSQKGDARKAESLSRDGVEKPRDARLGTRPHHFREDVRVEEQGEGRVHPSGSSVNLTGR